MEQNVQTVVARTELAVGMPELQVHISSYQGVCSFGEQEALLMTRQAE